jgi:hypothetical protein
MVGEKTQQPSTVAAAVPSTVRTTTTTAPSANAAAGASAVNAGELDGGQLR